MRFQKLLFTGLILSALFISCKNDDDGTVTIPVRDRAQQAIDDDEALLTYLQTHFYNYEEFENPPANFDYRVRFDTLNAANADKIPLIDLLDTGLLTTKTVTRDDVDYTIYILKIREGEGERPTFADSTFQNYSGELLDRTLFDNSFNPVWFDLHGFVGRNANGQLTKMGGVIPGFEQGITEFRAATGFEVNPDNTIDWNDDYGIGAIFIPSGLAYFNSPTPSIPPYSPLIFSIQLFRVNQTDHDGDGIPSFMEDLNNDMNLFNDDTDKDGLSNHSDSDDDGDGTPTRKEIIFNNDGTISFKDDNGNGISDHLDPDAFL